MSLLIGSITIGLILSLLALGIFISFRVFDFPDITAEGSFTFGASTAAALILAGVNPWVASLAAFLAGMLAGSLTGVIHTRFKINPLLAGILVMTALYSVNLHVMGKSNLPMMHTSSIFSWIEGLSAQWSGEGAVTSVLGWRVLIKDLYVMGFCLVGVVLFCVLLWWFFKTNLGTAMRATGDNSQMIRALGVNTRVMIIAGIALSNGFIALSGAILAQYQGFADVQMGIGMMVWGLASVIIGEAIINDNSLGFVIVGAVTGSILFRLLVAIALRWGLNPNDLKIITAVFVFVALILPMVLKKKRSLSLKTTMHA
ncbi:MAG TPA: ABC transporter permease [Bacteroidales bacterium]|jgi:putative ABC transport system permease protein|nr:ABC transporter permease [Bacteroidales bacterium]